MPVARAFLFMPKPKPAHGRTRYSRPGHPAPSFSPAVRRKWKLILVDQEPIRRAATQSYRQAGERLTELRGIIERFSTVEQPAFSTWMSSHFGALLTALRELNQQIDEKGAMLDAIQMIAFLGRLSPQEAYRQFLESKAAREKSGGANPAARNGMGDDEDNDFDDDDEGLFDDLFNEFGEIFGFPKQPPPKSDAADNDEPRAGTSSSRRGERGPGRPPKEEPSEQERTISQRVKAAYRAVVRRLHPDLNPDLTEYHKQLWHDAQQAYERDDLERLETIVAVSELERAGELPSGSGIGGLLALVRQLEESIHQLGRRLNTLKKQPAWNFTSLTTKASMAKLEKRIGTRLERDVRDARADLAMIEADLAVCQQPPPPRRPSYNSQKKKGGKGKGKSRR